MIWKLETLHTPEPVLFLQAFFFKKIKIYFLMEKLGEYQPGYFVGITMMQINNP